MSDVRKQLQVSVCCASPGNNRKGCEILLMSIRGDLLDVVDGVGVFWVSSVKLSLLRGTFDTLVSEYSCCCGR